MNLNSDAVRDILLYIEANQEFIDNGNRTTQNMELKPIFCLDICKTITPSNRYTYEEATYAARQLCLSNYVISNIKPKMTWIAVRIDDITWEGHNFINSVRGDNIWDLTKRAGKKLGNVSVKGLGVIAQTLLEKAISEPEKLQEFANNIQNLF